MADRVKGFAPRDSGVICTVHRVDGKVENLKRRSQEMGQQWLFGQRKSRGVFRLPRTSRGRKAKGRGACQEKVPLG